MLRNAVRYSPQDAPVDVSRDAPAERLGDSDSRSRTGRSRQRIWSASSSRFYRVAESRDRDTGGEGIGLAITSQVMKAHGGSAKAVNCQGGGFEVRLNLPEAALAV